MTNLGDVIAVGKGKNYSLTLKEGDTVLYSKFGLGVVDIEMKGQEYAILFERDCMGIMPSSDATVDDIKDLSPLGDRLVIKVDSVEDETAGGVLLTEGATEKPTTGEVVAVGPGRLDEITGEVTKNKLKVGERVNFFKWAGDAIDTTSGETYNIISEKKERCGCDAATSLC